MRPTKLLQYVIDATDDIVFSVDERGRCVLANTLADRNLGAPGAEALREHDADVLASGKPIRYESTLAVDGNNRVMRIDKTPFRGDSDRVAGFICVARDVTEHRLEERLRMVNDRLRTVITGAPIIVSAVDKDGIVTLSVGRGLKGFGEEWNHNVGKSVFETQSDNQELLAAVRRAMAGEEFTMMLSNEDRFLETTFSPLLDDRGSVSGAIAVSTDVTERYRTEKALREKESNLARAQKIARIGDWSYNEASGKVLGSDEAWRLLGLPPQDGGITYEQLILYVHPDDRERVKEVHKKALANDGHYRLECRIVLPGGETRIIQGHGEVDTDEAGDRRLRSTIQDITAQRADQEALKRKDREIRQAYANVVHTVTEGRLILLTKDEVALALGPSLEKPFDCSSFEDMAAARRYLRAVLESTGFDRDMRESIVLAAGEAITNGVKHGGSCQIQVHDLDQTCQVRISDNGPGIDFNNLPKATLLSGFSTKKSLGMGFTVILDICDRVLLATNRSGTTIVLEMNGQGPAQSRDDIVRRINL